MAQVKIKSRSWDVFQYEVYMYLYMYIKVYKSKLNINGKRNRAIKNSYVESLLLHTRILTEIFLYQRNNAQSDDILLTNYINPNDFTINLNSQIHKLEIAYGNSKTMNKPKYLINKLLVHATDLRKSHYNYNKIISKLHPLLFSIVEEIQSMTKDRELKKHISYYTSSMHTKFTLPSTQI